MSEPARKHDGAPPYRLEDQIGYLLGRARAVALGNLRRKSGSLDLTPPQLGALLKLMELGETSQNELGRQSGMKPATVHGVIRRLQSRGLVETRRSPEDQRLLLVALTAVGQETAGEVARHSRAASAETLAPLDENEQELLEGLLRRIIR